MHVLTEPQIKALKRLSVLTEGNTRKAISIYSSELNILFVTSSALVRFGYAERFSRTITKKGLKVSK